MKWNLKGRRVSGTYLDFNHVNGRVIESHISYNEQVYHVVELDRPRKFFGIEKTQVIIEDANITKIYPVLNFDNFSET